jgi:peroxiredoxin
MFWNSGISRWQGPHHVAQKFSTTTSPRKSVKATASPSGVTVVGVNVGLEEAAAVHEWIDTVGITFPIVVDDSARTLEALYRIRAMPTTFFIDSDGIIQMVESGPLTEESLTAGLIAMGYDE